MQFHGIFMGVKSPLDVRGLSPKFVMSKCICKTECTNGYGLDTRQIYEAAVTRSLWYV